jgi:hypothetical protein
MEGSKSESTLKGSTAYIASPSDLRKHRSLISTTRFLHLVSDDGPLTIPTEYQESVATREKYKKEITKRRPRSKPYGSKRISSGHEGYFFLDRFLEDLLAMSGEKPRIFEASTSSETARSAEQNLATHNSDSRVQQVVDSGKKLSST